MRPRREEIDRLRSRVNDVEQSMLACERSLASELQALPGDARQSARNLLHYLALRSEDLRHDQVALANLGLSSLGRAEPNALQSVRRIRRVLDAIAACPDGSAQPELSGEHVHACLQRRTVDLFGPEPGGRAVRIMVTMPPEAAHDYKLVEALVKSGMNVMRINCAHDGPEAWTGMIANLRRAREVLGRDCRIVMDIEGPKLRTGPILPGPCVVSWRSVRTAAGDLVRPALVGLGPVPAPEAGEGLDAWLPLDPAFIGRLGPGSKLVFTDRPGRHRSLTVVRTGHGWAVAESHRSAFVESGTNVYVVGGPGVGAAAPLGEVPPIDQIINLREGDTLILSADQSPGHPAQRGVDGEVVFPARVPITLPEVIPAVQVGHRVLLDDGKAQAEVVEVSPTAIRLRMTRTRPQGLHLRADRGINFPDTHLPIPALTAQDRQILGFVASNADAVEFSFVRTARDLEDLRQALRQFGAERTAVVLKIETAKAFENLPELLLAALTWPAAGVMIARGDLAVEVGYERMAEVQEEILWLCEAAHLPVVWATQVLETLAKKGIPSRSEITDAAMGERAECVMLNKGPFVLDAVRMLDDILRRMSAHQSKKRSMLRSLGVARTFASRVSHAAPASHGQGADILR